MGECIDKVWLPQALAMDISYETFQILNPKRMKPFAKAFKQKKEEAFTTMNYTAWLNGIYVANAIGSCLSKNSHYPEKPIEFNNKENQGKAQASIFEAWAIAFNKDFESKQKESVVE